MALYVDDLLIACSDDEILRAIKAELFKQFRMKNLGESHVMIGMDKVRDRAARTLTLTQARYTLKVIEWFGMSAAKGCATPMEAGLDLTAMDGKPCGEQYRAAIGALMCLMVGTRPGIAFAVCTLSKHVENSFLWTLKSCAAWVALLSANKKPWVLLWWPRCASKSICVRRCRLGWRPWDTQVDE